MVKNKEIQADKKSLSEVLFKLAVDKKCKYKPESLCFVSLGYITLMRFKVLEIENVEKRYGYCLDLMELITYLKLIGWESFGPLAGIVFRHWGLKSGNDFISIVDFLIENNVIPKDNLKRNKADCYPVKDFSFDYYKQDGLLSSLF